MICVLVLWISACTSSQKFTWASVNAANYLYNRAIVLQGSTVPLLFLFPTSVTCIMNLNLSHLKVGWKVQSDQDYYYAVVVHD